jgi:uncharacterized membrane protein
MRRDVGRVPGWAPLVTLPLALAGLVVSTYLTYVHYTEPTALSCPDTGVVNCTRVTTSPESMLFGVVPVALAGAIFFAGMTVLCLPALWRRREAVLRALRVVGAVTGIGMVLWLVYVEAVRVRAICLWCTAVHVIAFALFVAVLAATLWESAEQD